MTKYNHPEVGGVLLETKGMEVMVIIVMVEDRNLDQIHQAGDQRYLGLEKGDIESMDLGPLQENLKIGTTIGEEEDMIRQAIVVENIRKVIIYYRIYIFLI